LSHIWKAFQTDVIVVIYIYIYEYDWNHENDVKEKCVLLH